jgi:hypothetical protein
VLAEVAAVSVERADQVVGDIPREPPGFQPRAGLLAELERAGAGVAVVHAVAETRGVGKTQLAAAYARARQAEGWRLVAWVSAEDTGTLRAGLAAAADAAGLAEGAGQDGGDPGLAVRHRLETDGDRCLIVFDNVTEPEMLQPYLPVDGAAQVLITSYRKPDPSLGTSVAVDAFSAGEAVVLLAGRTGRAEDAVAAVAAELGHLPLALAQAAAVIAGEHIGYETYLDRLRTLSGQEDLIQDPEQPYPHRTAEAVLLSLEALRAGDQGTMCAGIMEIIAVLSGAGVRRELLHDAGQAGVLAGGGERATATLVDLALDQLAAWSLLTFSLDGQTIMAHRLVSQVIRDGLTRRDRLTAVCREAAAVLEARAQALAGSQDRLAVRDIPVQVAALADRAAAAAEADEELAKALLRLRFFALYHLIELGDSAAQAITVGESLIADLDRLLGADHPDTLNTRNSLAAAYQAAGRPAEAIPLFEQTLVGRERLLGPDHPDTLNSQNNLAAAYQDEGRTGEAKLLFELTLAARERLLGADDPSTLNSRGNLAAICREEGRPDEAIPLFEQTLAGREQVLGADHPDTLHSRSNLAAAYREAGRPAEAIPQLELILSARERQLGADHPSTLSARNNLAVAYRKAGRPAEAIPLVEETLAACERLFGAYDSRTLAARNNLAGAYREAGRPAEAIPLFEQLLAACELLFGPDHPRTMATRKNLALAQQDTDQPG